jgi:hypothetical protein
VRAYSALALGLSMLGQGMSGAPLGVSFHHIHVNDPKPDDLIAYYTRLFRAETTRPASVGQVRGIESQGVFLLIDPSRVMPRETGTAGWHFGWGTVSVDEAYDRHRMQEIEWELPLESFAKGLHLHLESENPLKAAEWYRDTLGAVLELERSNADVKPLSPIHRRPVAIARLDSIALAIYKSDGPIETSRGQRIDHIAFRADLEEVRRRADLNVVNAGARLGAFQTMVIEGPDHLLIELVGPPSFPPSYTRSEGTSNRTREAKGSCRRAAETRGRRDQELLN